MTSGTAGSGGTTEGLPTFGGGTDIGLGFTTTTTTTTENTATTTTSQCFAPNSVGDGYCDDDTNIESCWFDGGDCCNPDAEKEFCVECACLEEQGKSNSN